MANINRPQKSKRDRISTKVHDRIALARCEAAIRRDEQERTEVVLGAISDIAWGI
jgi:hypothetical protein